MRTASLTLDPRDTEIIFVEGNSSDDTYASIKRAMSENPKRNCTLLKQTGKGKGDAVRAGFSQAKGDILMILDADITVPPEDLPRFYALMANGSADFVNGVRLVYPMNENAMRFFNLIGNKFFSYGALIMNELLKIVLTLVSLILLVILIFFLALPN